MATTKKPAAKRASVKKAPAKKTVASRANTSKPKAPVTRKPAAKRAPSKQSAKSTRNSQMRSFHLSQDQASFTTFKITRQTVYWIILVAFIVFAQLWIIKLQVEVASLIEAQQAEYLNNI